MNFMLDQTDLFINFRYEILVQFKNKNKKMHFNI